MTRQSPFQRLVSDQSLAMLGPLLLPPPPAKNGRSGRPRVDGHDFLEGILFATEISIA